VNMIQGQIESWRYTEWANVYTQTRIVEIYIVTTLCKIHGGLPRRGLFYTLRFWICLGWRILFIICRLRNQGVHTHTRTYIYRERELVGGNNEKIEIKNNSTGKSNCRPRIRTLYRVKASNRNPGVYDRNRLDVS